VRKVEINQLGEMLEQPWLAILATNRRQGGVLLSPVWFEWDGTAFVISVVRGDFKEKHIRENPHVTICIAEEETFPGRMLEASGVATLEPDPGAVGIARIAERYLGSDLVRPWISQYGSFEWEIMRMIPEHVRALDHRDEPFLRAAKPRYVEKNYVSSDTDDRA
jgi:PPOX class probable F420-dependent enzyme